ncbi:MAG: tetratricopeptide repeat protein [Candidatus Delongbacteria bacterium]|nr:tetratricopeptide repeat protein [Candidatus Delongbacteria bacterium]MBN2833494.1 tetratricopeptide repeat protein [Candidatus Delongbacteria bacterium]
MNHLYIESYKKMNREEREEALVSFTEHRENYYNLQETETFIRNYRNLFFDFSSKEDCILSFIEGEILYNSSDYRKAITLYEKSLDLKQFNFDSYNMIALCYRELADFTNSIKYFQTAYDIVKSNDNIMLKCQLLYNLATVYDSIEKYDDAEKILNEIIDLMKWSDKNSEYFGMTYSTLSAIMRKIGRRERAYEYICKAIDIFDSQNLKSRLLFAYNNLGLLNKSENYLASIEIFKKALTLAEELGDKRMVGVCLGNIAAAYREGKDFITAEKFILKSLNIFDNLENKKYLIQIYRQLAILKMEQNDAKSTYEYFLKYIELYSEISNEKKNKEVELLKLKFETQKAEDEKEIFRLKNIELKNAVKLLEKANCDLKIFNEKNIELERKNSVLAMSVTANHEINQPLATILGSISILSESLNSKLDNKELEMFNRIKKSAQNIANILKTYGEGRDFSFEDYYNKIKMIKFKK